MPKWIKYVSLSVITIGIGFAIGYFVNQSINHLSPEEEKLLEQYHLLKDDWLFGNEQDYLDDLVSEGIISGPAEALDDPYTIYTDTYEEQGLSTDHLGLGFTSHSYDGGLYVVEVHNGVNQDKLRVGDVIYGCYKNDEEYFDFKSHSSDEINEYLRTDVDELSRFKMDILRGDERMTVELKRGQYTEKYVDILQEPTNENNLSLVIKINTFLGDPVSDVIDIINHYSEIKISNLVIDLRQNTGGLVSQADALSKLFVKKGTLIYQFRDKNNKVTKESYQTKDPTFTIPHYSLIIDDRSASASETFTLAMRAGTDCTVYGLKSFGKGIAQEFKTFSDGSVVKYTSSYVYGPERENETMYEENEDDDDVMCIHNKGIIPDVAYTLDYTYLQNIVDYTDSIYITEQEGEYLLKFLHDVYTDKNFPTQYTNAFRFEDAIQDFTDIINEKYQQDYQPFTADGKVTKDINDKLIKESYDAYLQHYDLLTESTL